MKNALRISALVIALGLPIVFLFNNCGGTTSTSSTSQSSSLNCASAPAHLRSPKEIDEVTALINSLPKPLSLACFIRSLQKPIGVAATTSTFSDQPADGPGSPRIFLIMSPTFVMSVVPSGPGTNLLEVSQFISADRSVKAEIEFPILGNLLTSDPYSRILSATGGTKCKSCHLSEQRETGFGGEAYSSNVLRPSAISGRITARQLYDLALNCNDPADRFRCDILRSFFSDGYSQDATFP